MQRTEFPVGKEGAKVVARKSQREIIEKGRDRDMS